MTSLTAAPHAILAPPRPPLRQERDPAPDGHVPIGDLWLILRHRMRWMLGAAIGFAALALVYSVLTPWLYSATAEILVDPRDKIVMANDNIPTTVPPDGGLTQVESQARVLESSNVLLRAIAATDLANDPEFATKPGVLSRLMTRFDFLLGQVSRPARDDADQARETALLNLRKRLSIKRADKVLVIDVSVKAQSPDKAARIANAIADAYLAEQAAARADATRQTSGSFMARLSEQQAKVKAAEDAVERYKADNAMLSANGVLMSDQQLSDANRDLTNAHARTAELRARIDQIDQARRTGGLTGATAEAIGSTVVIQLRARNAELVQHEADLRTQYGPRHPAIASVDSQLRDVRQLIATELDRIAAAARSDYDRARANEAELTKSMGKQTAETLAAKQASIHLRELERDLDANRTVYANFMLRAQETREQAGIDATNARIITRAMPPLDRSWPLIGYLVLGGLMGGLGLGAACAFASEFLTPTVLSRGHLETALAAPVIPMALTGRSRRSRAKAGGDRDGAFERILHRILDAGRRQSTGGILSLALTGAPGDAALIREVAEHLARTAEALGERVLLVRAGADPRGSEGSPGLNEVLRGELPLDLAVKRGPRSALATLDPGQPHSLPVDRRGDDGLARFFAQSARRFDLTIIDAGTMSEDTGNGALVARCDATVVVAGSGRTRQGDVADILPILDAHGSSVTVGVLTSRNRV